MCCVPGLTGNIASSTERHVVLLGDSTLDNGSWCAPGPCVTEQVHLRTQQGLKTTMCAVDGALIAAIDRQLLTAPKDANTLRRLRGRQQRDGCHD